MDLASKETAISDSMKGYNFKKCDPCRKSKKGCSGGERCVARGGADKCTRDISKELLANAIKEEKKKISEKSKGKGKGKESAAEENTRMGDVYDTSSDTSNDTRINIDAEIAANLATNDDWDTSSLTSIEISGHCSDGEIPTIDNPHAASHDRYSKKADSRPSSLSRPPPSDNESEHQPKPPVVGVKTRRQKVRDDSASAREAAEKLQADLAAAQPVFIFQLPVALQRWNHKKCDRCRYIKNCDCNGATPCNRCIRDNILVYRPCTREKGEEDFEKQKEEAREKQKDRWDDNREMAEVRAREREQKRQKEIRKLEIQLSEARDVSRKAKGAALKAKREVNVAVKKVEEIQKRNKEKAEMAEMERALRESSIQVGVGEKEDVEMKDVGEQDEDDTKDEIVSFRFSTPR